MLLLGIITLVMTIPLASVYLSSIFINIIAFLILILDGLLSYNTLYVTPSSTWVHLLGGLFQSSHLSIPDIILSILVPVMIYHDTETDKSRVLKDNKGKAGIYLWTHKESNKKYVGSAVDLSKRLSYYYSPSALKRADNYISRAIICYSYSAFSLSILEYIDISNKDKKEARVLILCREQYYIDSLSPGYNIFPIAGSPLGFLHTEQTLIKLREAKKGENHPLFGKSHTAETLALMSLAKKGIAKSEETRAKMSVAKGTAIYVYSSDKSMLINTFPSAYKAGQHFKVSHLTILKYSRNSLLFQEKWILSTTLLTPIGDSESTSSITPNF